MISGVAPENLVHAREAYPGERSDQRTRLDEGGGMTSHVPDLHHEPGSLLGGDDLVGLAERDAHRLLDEHVLARGERGERDRGVRRIGSRHEHGIEVGAGEELVRIGQRERHAERPGDALCDTGTGVADDADVEQLRELPQAGQVEDLPSLATADDPESQPAHTASIGSTDCGRIRPDRACRQHARPCGTERRRRSASRAGRAAARERSRSGRRGCTSRWRRARGR